MTTTALTDEGRNAIRDSLQANLDDMAVGTDGSDPSTTDTSLGNEVLRKAFKSEQDAGNGSAQFDMRVLSNEANGEALRELGLFAGSSMYARIAYAEINKTSDFEVEYEVRATVNNP